MPTLYFKTKKDYQDYFLKKLRVKSKCINFNLYVNTYVNTYVNLTGEIEV